MNAAATTAGMWRPSVRAILRQALDPPVRDMSFWLLQCAVIALAALHFYLDAAGGAMSTLFPTGSPVALLLVPVLFAALRYGLAGAAATALWATLLWLPDLILPDATGHPANDLIDLLVVVAVAIFVGGHIERGAMQRRRAESADAARRAAQLRYRELFQSNPLPIVIVDAEGIAIEVNPAAAIAFDDRLVGACISDALMISRDLLRQGTAESLETTRTAAGATRTYRVVTTRLAAAAGADTERWQMVFQDVTEEQRKQAAARSYAALLLEAHEEERRHIARDIHDDPLQRLIALSRRLESLGTGDDAVPTAIAIAQSRGEVLGIIEHLRQLARGLRPPGLDQLGLAAAVRGLLAEVEASESVPAELVVSGTPTRLEPGVELAAFRIIQEGVSNVTRHAAAQSLRVELDYESDALKLRVIDDGIGFDVSLSARPLNGNLGLVGMRERADLLGGTLVISSVPHQGTTIESRLPLLRPVHAGAA